jgi:hypothetical protein
VFFEVLLSLHRKNGNDERRINGRLPHKVSTKSTLKFLSCSFLQVVESCTADTSDLHADTQQLNSTTKQREPRTADAAWNVSQKNASESPQETRRQ